MITTVTLNPAIDRTVIVNEFAYGSVNRVVSSREDIGGKGINVARILLALESDAKAVGFIGKNNFLQADALLKSDAIPTEFVFVDAPTRINTKLIESSTHITTDINEAGFSVGQEELDAVRKLIIKSAGESSYIVFSGSVPVGLPASVYRELIELVPSHCKTVLDTSGSLLLEGIKAKPFLIKPNIDELESALGKKLKSKREIVDACSAMIRQYEIPYILVSMGAGGSILVMKDQAIFAAPLQVSVKSTVGAGDSMLAGFIHGLAKGFGAEKALAFATACGALAVSMEGTQSFKKDEAESLAGLVKTTIMS